MTRDPLTQTVLVSTWSDGLFVFEADARRQELAGQAVRCLAPDGQGGTLAIVDGHTLARRDAKGSWSPLATWPEAALACCVAVGDRIFAGTEDARVLAVGRQGKVTPLAAFDAVDGRDSWYAGTAVIDGKTVGPPLGVRSLAAAPDGSLICANVHVGGVPCSTDGGLTWQPTIDIASDIHEVRVHPTHPGLVAAAGAVGLCVSRDAGATWDVHRAGLHGPYCSAVAFVGDDVLVGASEGHFAAEGALYRCPVAERAPTLARVQSGLPGWFAGIIDTGCVAGDGVHVAAADRGSGLYVSADAGRSWHRRAENFPAPSSVLLLA